jgi:hypothetical protein
VSEALLLKGCGFNKVAIFTTNADAKNKLWLTKNVSAEHWTANFL